MERFRKERPLKALQFALDQVVETVPKPYAMAAHLRGSLPERVQDIFHPADSIGFLELVSKRPMVYAYSQLIFKAGSTEGDQRLDMIFFDGHLWQHIAIDWISGNGSEETSKQRSEKLEFKGGMTTAYEYTRAEMEAKFQEWVKAFSPKITLRTIAIQMLEHVQIQREAGPLLLKKSCLRASKAEAILKKAYGNNLAIERLENDPRDFVFISPYVGPITKITEIKKYLGQNK